MHVSDIIRIKWMLSVLHLVRIYIKINQQVLQLTISRRLLWTSLDNCIIWKTLHQNWSTRVYFHLEISKNFHLMGPSPFQIKLIRRKSEIMKHHIAIYRSWDKKINYLQISFGDSALHLKILEPSNASFSLHTNSMYQIQGSEVA